MSTYSDEYESRTHVSPTAQAAPRLRGDSPGFEEQTTTYEQEHEEPENRPLTDAEERVR